MNDQSVPISKQLAGVWRLVSSKFATSGGEVIFPLGEDADGVAIFTESGYMSAQLMQRGRPAFASGTQSSGTPDEVMAALQGYVAYYGYCEIDEASKTLTTHVEGSLFPNWVGGTQLRHYELSGSQLTLRTPPIKLGQEEVTGVLVWERR